MIALRQEIRRHAGRHALAPGQIDVHPGEHAGGQGRQGGGGQGELAHALDADAHDRFLEVHHLGPGGIVEAAVGQAEDLGGQRGVAGDRRRDLAGRVLAGVGHV